MEPQSDPVTTPAPAPPLEALTAQLLAERAARRDQEAETVALRDLVDHWRRLEAAKSHFLTVASHELRTPVTVLAGYLTMLRDGSFGELPATADRVVGMLSRKTGELADIINDMLETARLDDGVASLQSTPLDAKDLLLSLIEDWRPLLRPGQELAFQAPPEPLQVDADRGRLRTIVTNLLSNAVKYSPDGGDIVCSLRRDGARALIAVRDHGVGIAEESAQVLFTRFGRVLTPQTSRVPGTGLGLYIARELARLHGGDITVETAAGAGSVFTLSLPLATA